MLPNLVQHLYSLKHFDTKAQPLFLAITKATNGALHPIHTPRSTYLLPVDSNLPSTLRLSIRKYKDSMRLSLYGAATIACAIASVLAQDNQSSSSSNAVTSQNQPSQSQTQAASSSGDNNNSQSQTSSGSNVQSSAASTSAPPVTSVYSTAFETYSVSSQVLEIRHSDVSC